MTFVIPIFNFSGFPSKDCGGDALVSSKGFLFPVGVNGGSPYSFSSGVVDTMMAACVILHYCLISLIYRAGNITQVFNAVIGSISVYVVDLVNGVSAVIHFPNHTMRQQNQPINFQSLISINPNATSNTPHETGVPRRALMSSAMLGVAKHVRRSLSPKQFSGLGVVPQNLVKVLVWGYGFFSHIGILSSGLIEWAGAGTPARHHCNIKIGVAQ